MNRKTQGKMARRDDDRERVDVSRSCQTSSHLADNLQLGRVALLQRTMLRSVERRRSCSVCVHAPSVAQMHVGGVWYYRLRSSSVFRVNFHGLLVTTRHVIMLRATKCRNPWERGEELWLRCARAEVRRRCQTHRNHPPGRVFQNCQAIYRDKAVAALR
jgi:hypothetical protein